MTIKKRVASKYIISEEVWYHGRTVKEKSFDLKYVGNGSDQEGPGFYFSTSRDDAAGYAESKGTIMEVTLHPRKIVTGKPKRAEILRLMKMAPDFDDKLMDWDESPTKALILALEGTLKRNPLAKDAFQQVWYDFYRYSPKEYLEGMIALGYDGHEVPKNNNVRHMVVYNPAVIKIQETHDY